MEILGVGPSEFVFIVIIALIILGPKDMQKAGKTLGKWMRNIVTSDGWKMFQQTSRELRTLPNRLMRDANEELSQVGNELKDATNLTGSKPYNSVTPSRPQPSPISIPTPEKQIA
ncbi:MAG: twin-arginine translocase TatA/TatE family subunit, partial [Anaerolineales bacterium]|nr:twin-arginine translocase TatA/TatE family subunit [Anaerolineales bacterium]